MKRMTSTILAVLVLLCCLSAAAGADSPTETIRLENGDYIELTVQTLPVRAAMNRSGTKSCSYRNSDGTLAWKAILHGSFTYNGSTSSCTSASCTVSVYNDDWSLVSKSAVKNGNAAEATVVMGYKVLGVAAEKITRQLTLSCDKNGNLS